MYQVTMLYNMKRDVVTVEGEPPIQVPTAVQISGAVYPVDETPEAFITEVGKVLAARGAQWTDILQINVQRVPSLS